MIENYRGANLSHPLQKIAIAPDVAPDGDAYLRAQGYEVDRAALGEKGQKIKPDELTQRLIKNNVDAAIVRTSLDFNADVLQSAPLPLVAGAVVQPTVDIPAATRMGTQVLNTQENGPAVAEGVLAYLTSLSTGLTRASLEMRQDKFSKNKIGEERFLLKGRRLGVVGFGVIGRQVAGVGLQRGMEVRCLNDRARRPRAYDQEWMSVAEAMEVRIEDSLLELARWADILTLHVNETRHNGQSNKGMITGEVLDALGEPGYPGAIGGVLINAARAELVGESFAQLGTRVQDGRLRGLAIDVFGKGLESEFTYPFDREDTRVLTTPHSFGSTPEVLGAAAASIAWRLMQWDHAGHIAHSLVYPRLERFLNCSPGDMVLEVVHATNERGTESLVSGAIGSAGLTILDQVQTGDLRDGTYDPAGSNCRIFLVRNGNDNSYQDLMVGALRCIAEINKCPSSTDRPIISARAVATSDEQREALKDKKFNPNITEL